MLKRSVRKLMSFVVSSAIVFSLVLVLPQCEVMAANTTYYVDSTSGNDSNAGTSTSTPWKTLTKINSKTYGAGDKICFKAGGSWTGQLYPKGSGSSSSPIIIDMYGSGNKPIIQANGTKNNTLYFNNQQYWEINNLEITNTASSYGNYRAIDITGKDYGVLNHFYINNCYIHNVKGEVRWIGGSGTDGNGIYYATGFDASKRTGGVVFEILQPGTTPVKTYFNDIRVQNCTISDCSFGGVITKQWVGSVAWGTRSSSSDTNWTPHTNVIVKNNYMTAYNSDHACNTIYLTDVKTATVESNVCAGAGTCAIEFYYADNVVCQKNETYDTTKKAGGADYNGIDPDSSTTNMTIQYNYVHDNGDGILFCQIGFGGSSVARYNILQNNTRYSLNLHSASGATTNIYNNTIYTNKSTAILSGSSGGQTLLDSYGTYTINNNIFYASVSGPTVNNGTKVAYDYNCYYGATAPTEDTHSVTSNPLLVSPGTGGDGNASGWAYSSLSGYKLKSTSPCISKGKSISSNGSLDFFGGALYNGTADIGAHEYR